MNYDAAFSHLLCVNACYYQGLLVLATTLIGLSVVKYFIDWGRVRKIVQKEINIAKEEQNKYYINIMNKWIRSFIVRANSEDKVIVRLLNNAFAIETIKETYSDISGEDFISYVKTIKQHVESDLNEIEKQNETVCTDDALNEILLNLQNDLEILVYKSNENYAKNLLENVKQFRVNKGI